VYVGLVLLDVEDEVDGEEVVLVKAVLAEEDYWMGIMLMLMLRVCCWKC